MPTKMAPRRYIASRTSSVHYWPCCGLTAFKLKDLNAAVTNTIHVVPSNWLYDIMSSTR